jgi:ERCC4-related helicase
MAASTSAATQPAVPSTERAEHAGLSAQLDLLSYQRDMVTELLEHDGLTVMGKGMGLATVAAALLAVHYLTPESGGAVVILGGHLRPVTP